MGNTSKSLLASFILSVVVFFVQSYRSSILAEKMKRAVNAACGDNAPSTCGIPGDGDAAYQYATIVDRMVITDIIFALAIGGAAFVFLSITFNGKAI